MNIMCSGMNSISHVFKIQNTIFFPTQYFEFPNTFIFFLHKKNYAFSAHLGLLLHWCPQLDGILHFSLEGATYRAIFKKLNVNALFNVVNITYFVCFFLWESSLSLISAANMLNIQIKTEWDLLFIYHYLFTSAL